MDGEAYGKAYEGGRAVDVGTQSGGLCDTKTDIPAGGRHKTSCGDVFIFILYILEKLNII